MSEEIKYKGLVITEAEREFSKDFGSDKAGKEIGKFTIRIPLPSEKAQIISLTSRATGGVSLESITSKDYEFIRMIVTLNYVIVNNPRWWNGADNCPDEDFLIDLWKFYLDSEEKFQKKLKKN